MATNRRDMDDAARIESAQGETSQALGEGQDGVLLSLDSGSLFRCNHTAIAALESLKQ